MKTYQKQQFTIILWIILFLLASIFFNGSVRAETEKNVTFPETGYTIDGEFFNFFYSAKDPLLIFGYPISNACEDPITGITTQYFQRARFELIEEVSGSYIKLTKLGEIYYDQDEGMEAETPGNSPSCRYFAETGKSICYLFLDFYDTHNGRELLGLPISNGEIHENDRYVQYFENARIEWRPNAPDGQHIIPTDLGKIYFDEYANGIPYCPLDPIPFAEPLKIQSYAFVTDALLPANGSQTLYIIVLDQNYEPVQGAMMEVVLHISGSEPQTYRPGDTDENGISRLVFSVDDLPVKSVVQIEVNSRYQSLRSATNSWFRIWW